MDLFLKASKPNPRRYPVLIFQKDSAQWLIIRSAIGTCFPEVEPVWMSEVITATAFLDTVSVIPEALPRLIFIDLSLPIGEAGWVFLAQLKADFRFKSTPVIVLNNSETTEDVLRAFEMGAAGYITRPLTYSDWLRCLEAQKPYWWKLANLPIST